MPIAYKDIADCDEDERIRQIGEYAMSSKGIVGFITDSDAGKADRYISKFKAKFPDVSVVQRGPGPVANSLLVKVVGPMREPHV